jgi:hypothetical protein
MTEYESGVWDAVALINEHEDLHLNWQDIIREIRINQSLQKYWGEQAVKLGG